MEIPDDDHQMYGLHHHHVGGLPGSLPHRERLGEHRASAKHQPYPMSASCAHCYKLHLGWLEQSTGNLAHLTTAKTQSGVGTFTGNQLNGSGGTASNLRALAWLHLNTVNS